MMNGNSFSKTSTLSTCGDAGLSSRRLIQPHTPPSTRRGWMTGALPHTQLEGHISRRTALNGFAWPALAAFLPLGNFLEEQPPQTGSCATCIGVVDGTLGSCAGITSCISSYDDRPGHFIAPWSYEERSAERALDKIEKAVLEEGGRVQSREPGYLYAVFNTPLGTDDVEFLLPNEDTTIELRASSRLSSLPDWGRLEARFEELRSSCRFEVVPVLRNRTRLLGVVESPWDTFGPTPPTDMNYNNLDEPIS